MLQKMVSKTMVSMLVLAIIFFATIAPVQAQTYTVWGQVFDTDGVTGVDGVDVTVTDIDTSASLSATTAGGGYYQTTFGAPVTAPVTVGDTLQIAATYGALANTTTVTATGTPHIVDLILQQDITPPSVTNPTATPSSIPADGTTTSQLNVTVTDASGVESVTIDLSAIGGNATEIMYYLGDNVYSATTTAAVGTTPGTYNLQVNATDIYGNSNTSVSIPLTVGPAVSISTDKTSYTTGDTMHVSLEVTNPGGDLPVRFAVWLEKPDGDMYVLTFTSLTLPAGLEYSDPDFAEFTLPHIPAGTYTWNAAIIEPYGPMEFISHDTAEWDFGFTGTETEDITTVLEQITVVTDFGK